MRRSDLIKSFGRRGESIKADIRDIAALSMISASTLNVSAIRYDCRKFIRHRKRSAFACFQSYLLGKHYVAWDKLSFRHKAPTAFWGSVLANLLNIGRHPEVDTVPLSRNRAAHIEITKLIKLGELIG